MDLSDDLCAFSEHLMVRKTVFVISPIARLGMAHSGYRSSRHGHLSSVITGIDSSHCVRVVIITKLRCQELESG